jgi:6-phosphogluconolactonase
LSAPAIRILPDPERLAAAAAEEFVRAALAAVAARGRFAVALSGGSTPLRAYRLLARRGVLTPPGPLPWSSIHWFWGDERCVPPGDPQSNYGAWREAMAGAPLVEANVHRILGELEPAEAADRYEEALRAVLTGGGAEPSGFDLMWLGLGVDGHVASLFPGSDGLAERRRWVIAPRVYPPGPPRVSLTLPAIESARRIVCLVSGAEKAATLQRVLEGPHAAPPLPAEAISPRGELLWLVDAAAAARLAPS